MQWSQSMKANKEDYSRDMQYMSQLHDPSIYKAYLGHNMDLNMLRLWLKYLGMQAYKLSHELGNNA